MCKTTDVGLLGLHDECCGDGPDDCSLTTVEGDMLREACEAVADSANFLKDIVAEMDAGQRSPTGNDSLLLAKYLDMQQAVGELTRQLVDFMEPDAGLEPF